MTALQFQLEAARRSAQLHAMVLCDHDGLCVASSGDDGEEIAAHSALVARRNENFEGTLGDLTRRWNVRLRGFDAAGMRFYLCAAGGGGEPRAQQIHGAVAGISRILAA